MSDCLPAVELNPESEATASIIWLHGLGADGHDFESIVPALRLPDTLAVRFVFPHAPEKPITINQGYVMRAWFDILEPGKERSINSSQLLMSSIEVHKLIDREIERGVDSQRIVLAGFSQGGAVCYQSALTYDKPLAGLLALSTWFPTAENVDVHPANASLPIAVFHGTQDPIITPQFAESTLAHLLQMEFKPEFKSYPMPHAVCEDEINDISAAIQSWLV
jgi:phospholipase/carboxylesterase